MGLDDNKNATQQHTKGQVETRESSTAEEQMVTEDEKPLSEDNALEGPDIEVPT